MVSTRDDIFHIALLQEFDGSLECDKLIHARHIDTIVIGITHLRRGRYNHNLLGIQTIKNTDDTLFQRCSAHNAVVYNHQIVHMRYQASVCNVVHMSCQVITAVTFGNECTQLDILYRHLLAADAPRKDFLQFLVTGIMPQFLYLSYLQLIKIIIESFEHTIKRHLRRVRNEGEHGVLHLIIYRFQDRVHQLLTQQFPFLINIHVTAPAEIDTLKRACLLFLCPVDLRQTHLSGFIQQDSLPRLQLVDAFDRHIECCLNDRTL